LPDGERCVRSVEEDEGKARCGDWYDAGVVGLVAGDCCDVLFAFEAPVDFESASKGLACPGDVLFLGYGVGLEVPKTRDMII
jgi:hypothetical protein